MFGFCCLYIHFTMEEVDMILTISCFRDSKRVENSLPKSECSSVGLTLRCVDEISPRCSIEEKWQRGG
jgi:hypothetical protein